MVIKIVWDWQKDRQTETPEIDLHIYSWFISNKSVKTGQWEKDTFFKIQSYKFETSICKNITSHLI